MKIISSLLSSRLEARRFNKSHALIKVQKQDTHLHFETTNWRLCQPCCQSRTYIIPTLWKQPLIQQLTDYHLVFLGLARIGKQTNSPFTLWFSEDLWPWRALESSKDYGNRREAASYLSRNVRFFP